jgi:L-asparaginase II
MSHATLPNPVLVEVTRGPLVESVHRGALVVVGVTGPALLSLGDTQSAVYPRSAIKLFQALPLIETGAADAYRFGAAEIALACGSHVGLPRHVAIAQGMLDAIGRRVEDLACGAAVPLGARAAEILAASGGKPTPLHHNCSGKHAGMLAVAGVTGAPIDGYFEPRHPVQMRVHETLSELTGQALQADVCGVDGCSVPTWAMTLEHMARLFARLASGEGLTPARRTAVQRLLDACWREPELVSGPGRADSVVMAALPGRIYMKTGAEGVYCGAVPELGVGFALKIDDGAQRASAATVMPLIERMLPQACGLVRRSFLKSSRGNEIGTIRSSAAYERALAGFRV